MESIRSTSRARNVARVDLVFTILNIIHFVYTIFKFIKTINKYYDVKNAHPDAFEAIKDSEEVSLLNKLITITWIQAPFVGIFLCVNLWAVYKLLQITLQGGDPVVGLRRAVIWRNIGIVYMIVQLGFGAYILTLTIWGVLDILGVLFRAILVCCVWGFISDLKFFIAGTTSMPGNNF